MNEDAKTLLKMVLSSDGFLEDTVRTLNRFRNLYGIENLRAIVFDYRTSNRDGGFYRINFSSDPEVQYSNESYHGESENICWATSGELGRLQYTGSIYIESKISSDEILRMVKDIIIREGDDLDYAIKMIQTAAEFRDI